MLLQHYGNEDGDINVQNLLSDAGVWYDGGMPMRQQHQHQQQQQQQYSPGREHRRDYPDVELGFPLSPPQGLQGIPEEFEDKEENSPDHHSTAIDHHNHHAAHRYDQNPSDIGKYCNISVDPFSKFSLVLHSLHSSMNRRRRIKAANETDSTRDTSAFE